MHPKRFMFHGSVRDKGRGVPRCLYQKKETTKLAVAQAKWTLKVSTLKGYAAIPGNIALYLYDSKPFYLISNTCEEVKWKHMNRQVWHRELKKMVDMPFFRLNLIHDYNHGMNYVDLANQVRNVHQWDIFIWKSKWWWSIMMWCLKMLQTNAYVLYTKYMTMHHLKEITHFEFNRNIYLAWIDSENYWPQKKHAYQHQVCSGDSTSITKRSTNTVSEDFINISPIFTDKSLCLLSGNISVRLQESDPHWPVPNLKKCKLSITSLGNALRQEDARYSDKFLHCEVTLCVAFFVPFHTITHLSNIKISLVIISSVQ